MRSYWLVVIAGVAIASVAARGLDSSRALTQALHRIWQVPQGLPEATIYTIRQTSDGYVWLGTQTGLVRFDGVRFVPVTDETPTWIQDLVEDRNHVLWAATNGRGLVSVEGGAVVRHSLPDGLTAENVHELLCDSGGTTWACTGNGVARLAKGAAVVYRTGEGLATNNVRAACEDRQGRVWVGGDSTQLSMWERDHFVAKPLASLPPFAGVRALWCGTDGTMWAGTTNGLVRLDKDGVERRFTMADGLADDWVNCLAAGADGALWVGTNNGFSRLRGGEFDSFRSRDGLSQSTVYAVFEDREGSLWVGTKHGLNQFLDRRTIPFTQSEGLSGNDTGPVLQDGSGGVWVGTLDSGLNRFDGHRFSVLTTRQGLASNSIRALADDGAGGVWVGTDLGLNRLQGSSVTGTYTTKDGLPADEITCAFRDPREGRLWVGTVKGAAVLDGERFVALAASGVPASAAVTTVFNRRDGTLMIGTRGGGLYRYRDGRAEAVSQGEARHPDVAAFFEDDDGMLWVGTIGGGLRLIDGARTVTFGMRDGLFDDDIYGIVEDDQDRLWMPCSKGIFYVSRSDLRRFASGALHRLICTPFSPTDALRTVECKSGVQPAAARMGDGRLWFSTVRGVIVVDPERLRRKAPPPPVVVEEMVVNGQRESAESIGRLSPGVKNLEFRYAGLSFLSPGRMTFRYKLDGFDADWIDAGARREAFYTNLSPGNYVFRVAASNGDGTPTGSASPVAFSVAPYFYQWRGFIPVCVAVVALAGWLVYRLRVRRIKGRMQDILTERSRIARELHDTLLQGFSGVTMEMQALSTRLPTSGERATLEEIIRDAATCMREARRSVAGLRTPPGHQESGFAAALAQAARQLTETRDVRLKLRLDGGPAGLPADVEYNLLRIASEAVSNAVRHSGARTIEVALDCADGRLVLGVKDDGVGFDGEPAAGDYGGHYGLVGMRERAAQIGAELKLTSQRGRGTVVNVTLPIGVSGGAARAAMDS